MQERLPMEIFLNGFRFVDDYRTWKSVRLYSRRFNGIVANCEALFSSVNLSVCSTRLHALESIAKHPDLYRFVRKLVYLEVYRSSPGHVDQTQG
jgi:hypothetical protein